MVVGRLAFGSNLPPPSQLELELPEHERRGRASSCWQLFPCYLPDSCKPPDVCSVCVHVSMCERVLSSRKHKMERQDTELTRLPILPRPQFSSVAQLCLTLCDPLKPCLTHTHL